MKAVFLAFTVLIGGQASANDDAQFCQEQAYRKAGEARGQKVSNVQCTEWVISPSRQQTKLFNSRRGFK